MKSTKNLFKKHHFDAGFDIESAERVIIPAGSSALISTGLHIEIPAGCVGKIWSRSGLSVKYNIEVGAGVIDHGYTGEVKVHLYNHGYDPYKVAAGDRIAQLVVLPIMLPTIVVVDKLDDSARGDGGFGSTGQ